MKNVLKLTSVLMFSASFFLASCSKDNMKGTEAGVTMRTFSQADAGSDQLEEGTEIKKISNEVSDNWTSTVFRMEEGKMVACDCNMDDFEITQVFLKQHVRSNDHTFLYQNGVTTGESHVFTGDDVIGIDMNYNGQYVRMSDIDVFGQSQGSQYQYIDELGVEVFANGNAGTNSAVYYFPILSTEADPGNSLSGMWMRIVLDFN
tara:strand:- start:905 stop:1516 length:612 start_codon:yes stop_codon:yes gene_type:complete